MQMWPHQTDEAREQGKPNFLGFYESGELKAESWPVEVRDGKPTTIEYSRTGVVETEIWRDEKHELDREEGPAEIHLGPSRQVGAELWYRHGELHREDGPAEITYLASGEIDDAVWYLNGEEIEAPDDRT